MHLGVQIQRLTPADRPLIHELLSVFGRAFNEEGTYGAHRPSDDYLARVLGDSTVVALAAVADGHVVAGLVAYELRKLEQARSEFYIYDLAVAEAQRRQGVATALIDALREIAAERGGWVIFVQADYGDDPAVALYTKLGTREDVMHFDIQTSRGPRGV